MVKDLYQKAARNYDKFVEPFNIAVRQIGYEMYPPKQGMRVLDVGCGTGTNLELYHQAGCDVYGIDLSPAMLDVARGKLGERADIRLGDASEMPYPHSYFDLVTSMLALHEMPHHIRSKVISEMARTLNRNGRILLIDFHPGPIRFPKGWLYKGLTLFFEIAAGLEHFRNYRDFIAYAGLPGLISQSGLKVEKKKIVSGGNMGLFLLNSG